MSSINILWCRLERLLPNSLDLKLNLKRFEGIFSHLYRNYKQQVEGWCLPNLLKTQNPGRLKCVNKLTDESHLILSLVSFITEADGWMGKSLWRLEFQLEIPVFWWVKIFVTLWFLNRYKFSKESKKKKKLLFIKLVAQSLYSAIWGV